MSETDAICSTCAHCIPDMTGRQRCYSPELKAIRLHGIACVFERGADPETDRGSRKCGPDHSNHKIKE